MTNNILLWMNRNLEYLILGFFLAICFFHGLGSHYITNINEGLYAEIPREMLESGNFIIPHLNYVPYLEKPPMLYWLVALSYKIFGISAWSARLVPAVAAAFITIIMLHFARRVDRRESGFITAIMLATCVSFILMARVLIFDMLFALWLTLCLTNFYYWYQSQQKKYLRWMYLFLGCAVLTKGLMAIVFVGGIACIYLLLSRANWRHFLTCFDLIGILIFLGVTVPWHLAASLMQSEFAYQYFINEHVLRFLDQRIPNDYHKGPIYFYLRIIPVYLLPWTVFLPLLWRRENSIEADLKRFLWVWFLLPLCFFSLSKAKGDYYMVMAMPPLVMLIAMHLQRWLTTARVRSMLITITASAVAFMGIIFALFYSNYFPEISSALKPILALLILYASCVICSMPRIKSPLWAITLMAGLMLPLMGLYHTSVKHQESNHSAIKLTKFVSTSHPEWPVFLYQDFEDISTIPLFLQHRVSIIDTHSADLYFGSRSREAGEWFPSSEKFLTIAARQPVYVFAKKSKAEQFTSLHKSFRLVAQSGNTVVFTNQ